MENYTYDYINGTDIYLYQHKKMFRINTDTALLAQFMKVKKGERVLDIGTNNGALLLAAHRYAPPYFKVDQESNLNESQSLQMARHERFLTLRTLCQRVSELLDEKGRFYMVHRASRISEIAYTLKQHRLEIRTLQFVYDANREEAVSVLVEAVKDGRVNAHVLLPQIIER